MSRRPSALAVRALNQYRRRDVIAYLGLRYYLHNSSAQSEIWSRELTPKIVLTRSTRPYLHAHHFKEIDRDAAVKHRPMFLPGPNEALAEVALLDECSKHQEIFGNPASVFSYQLAVADDRSGAFEYYSKGLRARHTAIAEACDAALGSTVRYMDIKRFYPSIRVDSAQRAWRRFADASQMPTPFRELGEQLITDYSTSAPRDENGILTGPMFSHLLANLVLRDFDEAMAARFPGRYFRYVDDITIVGDDRQLKDAESEIGSRLGELGLSLHGDDSPKSLRVAASEWLVGRDDYLDIKDGISWVTLIGDLKRLLLRAPSLRGVVQEAFVSHGIRIPVHDYSTAARERGYVHRFAELARSAWFRRVSRNVTIESLVSDARILRDRFEKELAELLAPDPPIGFEKKRLIPKLRFRAGRLAYLSEPGSLKRFADSMRRYPELQFHSGVLNAIASNDLDELLPMGTNAAQAAAQPLRAANVRCKISKALASDAAHQSLAVFILNGVQVDRPAAGASDPELLRFAADGADSDMMKSSDAFLRELACLHGLTQPRHSGTLESVFDEDERLAIDAVEQLQDSTSL